MWQISGALCLIIGESCVLVVRVSQSDALLRYGVIFDSVAAFLLSISIARWLRSEWLGKKRRIGDSESSPG
jgi:hypothetical protein